MNTIIPQNDILLCTLASSNKKKTQSGFIYESNDILLYKIENLGPSVSTDIFKRGDVIIAKSSGSKITINGIEYVLIKEEDVAGRVV